MIKVCHMTSAHKRYDTRIFQKECTSLAKAGYEVYLVVNDNQEDEVCDGVKIISTGLSLKNRRERMRKGTKAVFQKAVETGAEVYHIHDPELLPSALKLKKTGKKVIFDSHEFYYFQIQEKHYIPSVFRKIIAIAYKNFEARVVAAVDAVIVPCTLCGENYFETVAKRTVFLNNVPEKQRIPMRAYDEKAQPVRCCMVGSLSTARGLRETLTASKDTGVPLVLAGNADMLNETEKSFLDKQRKENSMLNFRGFVNREGVNKIYQESHIGLSLLHNKGQYDMGDNLPTKVYEYMLAGMPVVVSRQRYSVEFFTKYPAGLLVNIENQKEINEAILYLRDHPKKAREMGELGHKVVTEKFCWEKESEKLLELYQELSEEPL